jgi:hypothetical protein
MEHLVLMSSCFAFDLPAYIISAVQVFMHKLCPLQGLIPRATSLAQLGGSFFLAFLPAVLVISLLFSAIYFVSLLLRSNAQSVICLTRLHRRQRNVSQCYNWHEAYALCVGVKASRYQFLLSLCVG